MKFDEFNDIAYWRDRRISQWMTSSKLPTPLSVDLRWRLVWMNVYEGADYDRIADVLFSSVHPQLPELFLCSV